MSERDFKKAVNSKRFLRACIVNDNVTIVEYKPEEILYDSPFSVAASILDLAKLHLYRYYYDILKPAFVPDEIQLLMTDTDSLIFSVNCENFFEKYKIMAVRIMSKWELKRIARAVGASPVVKLETPSENDLGFANDIHFKEISS